MQKTHSDELQQPCQKSELNQKPQQNDGVGFLTYSYYLNCLSFQLLHLSNYLNLQLIKNQSLIDAVSTQSYQPSNPSQKGPKSENNSTASYIGSMHMAKVYPDQVKKEKRDSRKKKHRDTSQSQQYQPSPDLQERWSYYNTNSSKKIATDYCKAIFDFMQSNHIYVSRLLDSLGIEQNQFKESLQKYRGKVNSLVQFHSLWKGHQNNFSKAFRIISMQYSRKHRLGHIFASKTNNCCKHIKYRNKIMQTIRKPFLQD